MVISDFGFARIPQIVFGVLRKNQIGKIAAGFGTVALLVTGARSLEKSGMLYAILRSLQDQSVLVHRAVIKGEPSPEQIDRTVNLFAGKGVEVVIAVGGGSVIDAGKALSAMLLKNEPVLQYLEGVGTAQHDGEKIPFVAIPTTAGTGSEATKNAVLSQVGAGGFKKSLRHDNFVPDVAVVDPELMLSCPAHLTAACGMDAFTQLLESYVSTKASPMTDALAFSGIKALSESLLDACGQGANDTRVRGKMAYAALMSGITLANAGLGLIHGLAGPIGGRFAIPHGVVCGTLMSPANAITIRLLLETHGSDHPIVYKFAKIGAMLAGEPIADVEQWCALLIDTLDRWTNALSIPRLSAFGIVESDLDAIVAEAGNKNNPVALDEKLIREILLARL